MVSEKGMEIRGADLPGLHYGVTTLAQVLDQEAGSIPAGRILDWPDFPVRGVMIDISRDKVPSMETLQGLVDTLGELKINHLERVGGIERVAGIVRIGWGTKEDARLAAIGLPAFDRGRARPSSQE